MRKTVLLLASVAAAAVLPRGAVACPRRRRRRSPEGNARVPRRRARWALEDLVAMRGGPPGAIAVVQRGEAREVHAFGEGNIATGRTVRVDDRVRLASTSKSFSGAVALSLVGKGAMSLDDTVGGRLPGLPAAWSGITLRQLLNTPGYQRAEASLTTGRPGSCSPTSRTTRCSSGPAPSTGTPTPTTSSWG